MRLLKDVPLADGRLWTYNPTLIVSVGPHPHRNTAIVVTPEWQVPDSQGYSEVNLPYAEFVERWEAALAGTSP